VEALNSALWKSGTNAGFLRLTLRFAFLPLGGGGAAVATSSVARARLYQLVILIPIVFCTPCECRDAHGKARVAVKNGPSLPPADANAIQAVTTSDIFSWPGPDIHLTGRSERTGIENNWYALTARVVAIKAETDGDLHIELQDATGDKPGIVVVEVPAKPQWCETRKTVFIGRVRDSLFTLALLGS
jgi:hypothetical protein